MFRMIGFLVIFGLLTVGCAHVDTKSPSSDESFAKDAVESLIPTSNADEPPVQIYEETPEYPDKARLARKSGDVTVQIYVGSEGNVLRAKALNCSQPGMGFEEAAVKAAFKGRWQPARLKGKPAGVWVAYKTTFVVN